MKTHELKTEPPYFQAVLDGRKRFEIRKNDRGFEEGDKLLLKEYDADVHVFTGRRIEVTVTYITDYEQQPGYVVLSIRKNGGMNDVELSDIEERLNETTQGEWFRYHDEGAPMNIIGTFVDGEEKGIGEFYHDEDVDFIVNAPNDMRRLLDEVERLRKENEKQKETLQQIEKWLTGTLANEDLTIVESKVLEIARKALKV
ncbi:ASCH/PUA domain-containing protein [Aneurinibacillus migulanus]|uniref:ASCH/PUA domain-containing protein n=1 Tax=Aneurinibacillus migulanus TaxID=47500 RepID=UPI0009BB6ECF|nr:ASCH/PUA domain-containing protein [Aneurinibacillus migulanus]